MVRTNVYLPARQRRALGREARRDGIPLTELVRRIVGEHLEGRRGIAAFPKEEVLRFVALGRGARSAASARHDDALDEALRAGRLR